MSEVSNINEKQENAVQLTAEEPAPASAAPVADSADEGSAAAESDAPVAATAQAEEAAGDVSVNATEASPKLAEESSPKIENKKTPVKRTPSKRMSFIERAQKESEELVKNMGGSLELEGGRRTRSSARGTPTRAAAASTPPPAKKARSSPANASTTPSRGRGRGRKIDISTESTEDEATKKVTETDIDAEVIDAEKPTTSEKSAASNESNDTEKTNNENAKDDAVAKTTAAADKSSDETKSAKSTEKPVDEPEGSKLEKKSADKVDAASSDVVESVPAEKQNNVDHVVAEVDEDTKKTEKDEPPKLDSPMETDEIPEPEAAVGAKKITALETAATKADQAASPAASEPHIAAASSATAIPAAVVAEKEPTPEPMEVDSSSKSNDDDCVEITGVTPAPIVAEKNVAGKAQKNSTVAGEAQQKPQSNATPAAVTVVPTVDVSKEKINASATETVTAAIVAADNAIKSAPQIEKAISLESAAAGEPQATCAAKKDDAAATLAVAAANDNKSENDFCEPKIASPPINATNDGAVSTPQFCN